MCIVVTTVVLATSGPCLADSGNGSASFDPKAYEQTMPNLPETPKVEHAGPRKRLIASSLKKFTSALSVLSNSIDALPLVRALRERKENGGLALKEKTAREAGSALVDTTVNFGAPGLSSLVIAAASSGARSTMSNAVAHISKTNSSVEAFALGGTAGLADWYRENAPR
jgi:hypothetical protein